MIEVYVNGKAYIEKKYFNKIMAGEIAYRDGDFSHEDAGAGKRDAAAAGCAQQPDRKGLCVFQRRSCRKQGEGDAGSGGSCEHVLLIRTPHRSCGRKLQQSTGRWMSCVRRPDVKPLERLSVGREKNDFDKLYFLDH